MSRHAAALPLRAVALIVAATLCFAVLDASVKSLASRYPIALLVFARWAIQAVALFAWLGWRAGRGLAGTASRPGLHLLRGLLLCGSSICFVSALRSLPLADATALNYSAPVLVTVMAAIFLGERLTLPRTAFIAAGIGGMLLVVRPGTGLFQGAALLAAASALLYSTFQILTRVLAREDWRVLLFVPALVSTVVMGFALPFVDWPARIEPAHVALLVGASLVGTTGHFLFLRAFQAAPASGLTPFTYSQLVWATLVGWLAFGNFPDGLTLAGMAVIAASGLTLTFHERRAARRRAARMPAAID